MHCIQDNTKQKISTAIIRKSVIRRLSTNNYKHSILNKLKSENNISEVIFILEFNKVCFTMFSKKF